MSKALQGVAELAGAVGMGALAFFQPELLAVPFYTEAMGSLALGGLAMEAGAIADALTSNRGQNITTRQPASFRQVIYGTQRVGGVEIYRSTTGSHKDQFNYVIVIATHECWGIENLYLDGRQVFWQGSGNGWTVSPGGMGFGGNPDGNDHTGPNGVTYNFGGKVFCEARYGTQSAGDVIGGLTANDPTWNTSSSGSPFVGGCTYVYLKLEYDTTLFPGEPEIRFTVKGKPVYDPRTSATTYSHNPALIINDLLTDTTWGLGDASVNQAQLIAAANICEEQVTLAIGGTEDRYAAHWHYDTSTTVGDAVSTFMGSMGGRLSRISGEWYIFPAAYLGPTASIGADQLTGPVQWSSTRSFRDLFNRVTGTYTAPNYPYNVAGDLYDANGWYDGEIQNNFPFAFQPTNYPQYACDVLHGYASDEFLNEDGGIQLPKELGFPAVLSVSQAQRLARIALRRNRQQGSGTLEMSLAAFQLQPCDTFQMTFAQNGWADKVLEVNSTQFRLQDGGNGAPPQLMFSIGVNETDASVYEWNLAEDLSAYDVPIITTQASYTPAAPTSMTLISSAATALLQPDGTVVPRIEVTWDTPLDVRVTQIQMQYQLAGAAAWTDAGQVDVSLNAGYISPVVSGEIYNVRIRSLRASGTASSWVQIDGFTAGIVLSVLTQDGIGIGSLIGEAYPDGTAGIDCQPFTALLGNRSLSYFPSGPVVLTGLAQQTMYYVYVVDASLAGGNLTPVATQTKSDYLGKLGYFLIDSIVTPYAAPPSGGGGGGGGGGTGGSRYVPSSFQDTGTRTTSNAAAAYDGDLSTFAQVSGATNTLNSTAGDCIFQGFPAIGLSGSSTLTVVASVTCTGASGSDAEITATINGSPTSMMSVSSTTAQATYTLTVAASTPLNTISVEVQAFPIVVPSGPGRNQAASVSILVSEIYVQS